MKVSRLLFSVLFCLGIGVTHAFAQESTSATATVEVESMLGVTSGQDLDFGLVSPGDVVHPDLEDGARFSITGTEGEEVEVDFTLPTALEDGEGGSIPLLFDTEDAGWNTTDDALGATEYDPATTLTESLDATSGELFIWLTGEITVDDPQPAGTYEATIDIDVSYTAN
jgi:hypothetical protein